MCGRYALVTSREALEALLRLSVLRYTLTPRYNIAPTQSVPVVRSAGYGKRELVGMHWGLIPAWSKDRAIASRLINARSETADTKPAFRNAFKLRRCVIPADGFFEWKRIGKRKQPMFVHRVDGTPMLLAGLWDVWHDPATSEQVESCTILTTEPNQMLAAVHNRMPAVLDNAACDTWLDVNITDSATLKSLLAPAPDDQFAMRPVSTRVNTPANDDPSLLDPVKPIEAPEPADHEQSLFD